MITLEVDNENPPGVKSSEINLIAKDTSAVRCVIASGPEKCCESGDAVVDGIGGLNVWIVIQWFVWIPKPYYSPIRN